MSRGTDGRGIMSKSKTADNPWDKARRTLLKKFYSSTNRMEKLDRGVNYFVLQLEKLGARTIASCEGHPFGFYIYFEASYDVVLKINQAGFFQIQVDSQNRWILCLERCENGDDQGASWNERKKRQTLRWAATNWSSRFEQ